MSIWAGITPRITTCLTLREAIPGLPEGVLLHAGPNFAAPLDCPQPIRNGAIAAGLAEGWAQDPEAAELALTLGEWRLEPAQNWRVVTPLACVVSPSMPVFKVEAGNAVAFVPVNDGPPNGALRFGASDPNAQVARIALMQSLILPLQQALAEGIALLPLMAQAIAAGDDLHGSVAAMTGLLADRLALSDEADAYARTPLFALNPAMGAAAAMLGALAATATEPMVIAAGGNGVHFGWKTSDAPETWQTRPALPPIGPRLDPQNAVAVLPAIGDSAVIDALGLGGPILRHAPALHQALAPFHPAETFAPSAAFCEPHPELPQDIRLGLSAGALTAHPGIMLAMLGAGGEGLLGRGLAPWPA